MPNERIIAALELSEKLASIERIITALEFAEKYGSFDGGHHKQWVLDQMVRVLIGNFTDYYVWRGENPGWDEGIAP